MKWLLWLVVLLVAQPLSIAWGADDVADWVAKLGHQDLTIRNMASAKLRDKGTAAAAALNRAAKDRDPEVASRARELLEAIFQQPLPPGSDPRLLQMISQAESPQSRLRQSAVSWIARNGHLDRAIWLMERETDEMAKSSMRLNCLDVQKNELVRLVLADDLIGAENLLENRVDSSYVEPLAHFLHVTGKAPARIAKLQADSMLDPQSNDGKLLWSLLKLSGDRKSLVEWGKRRGIDDEEISLAVWGTQDWSAIVEVLKAETPSDNAYELARIAHWGSLVALTRGGNLPEQSQAMERLDALRLSVDETTVLDLASTWIRLGDVDRAVELLKKRNRNALAELFIEQGNFRAAFELVGLPPTTPASRAITWLNGQDLNDEYIDTYHAAHPVNRGVLFARALHQLGETRVATELLAKASRALTDEELHWDVVRKIFAVEFELGIGEAAEQHFVEYLEYRNKIDEPQAGAITRWETKLPHPGAENWFYRRLLDDKNKSISYRDLIRQARQMYFPAYRPALSDTEWEAVIKAQLPSDKEELYPDQAAALADVYLIRGKTQAAIDLLRTSISRPFHGSDTRDSHRLIQLYLDEDRRSEAQKTLQELVKVHPNDVVGWWLSNMVDEQLGDRDAADRDRKLAKLMSFGSTSAGNGREWSDSLISMGVFGGAAYEWDILLKQSVRSAFRHTLPHQHLASHYSLTQPKWALDRFELATAWRINERQPSDFKKLLRWAQDYWACRAAEHQQAGRTREAPEAWLMAAAVIPHNVEFVIAHVPRLQSAGDTASANAIFDRAHQSLTTICTEHKRAAFFHSELARLTGFCNRMLDDGLKFGQIATELDPTNAGYLSNLAEVQFRRGDHAQAMTLAQRASELDPGLRQVREQLRRFAKSPAK
jgi:tetratricopeptide (TPR) repeat protein